MTGATPETRPDDFPKGDIFDTKDAIISGERIRP